MLVERLSWRNHTSYCFGRCFWLAPPNMNSEIYFLVIVLYFFLFLDLYSTFVDHLCASESCNAKNRGKCRKEEVVERNTFGPSKIRNAITPTAKNDVNFIKFHFQAKVTKECYRVGKVKDKHQDYIRNGYGGGIKKPLVVHGGKIRELSARLLWTTSFLCRKQRKCE